VVALLSWGMFYGTIGNLAVALLISGAPAFEDRLGYWLGLVYLGVFASALAFTFYLRIIRAVGPGRAAYSSLLVPIIAMALSTMFRKLSLDASGRDRVPAGAARAVHRASLGEVAGTQ
jgi:drug/metabolite transporter (DMT)-like permease